MQEGAWLVSILTVRRLDPLVKEQLRVRAARHGHSMEEEARRILAAACAHEDRPDNLADMALALFGPEHGVELELPVRQIGREPPRFD
jgi:plasmid stability protein